MSEPLDLAAIRSRAESATPGPWDVIERGTPSFGYDVDVQGGIRGMFAELADASFVSAAREDVPRLVAEVERQAAELAAFQPIVAAAAHYVKCHDSIEAYYELLERLVYHYLDAHGMPAINPVIESQKEESQ